MMQRDETASVLGVAMYYYAHHIGDFVKDTTNLNDHQMVTYLRMLWQYYDSETPFTDAPEDIAFAMRSDEKTVALLLKHYFVSTPEGWRHNRVDKEIKEYKEKGEKRSKAAKARWEHANALQVQSNSTEIHANHKPITNNQEPYIKDKGDKPPAPRFVKPALDELITEFTGRVHDPTGEANTFFGHYESNGWRVGKNKMVSWKHAVTNWITRGSKNAQHQRPVKQSRGEQHDQAMREYFAELDREEASARDGMGSSAQPSLSL